MDQWWALMIGNSRLHWATFTGDTLQTVHHTAHGTCLPGVKQLHYLASVVPQQSTWIRAHFPTAKPITLADIPLENLYPQLGIDRALAVWGAGQRYGFPCLVVDGGTALTFSAANGDRQWIGGAILPGLNLQFQSLTQHTAALPKVHLPTQLPPRWANDPAGAIASGITYTVLAGVKDFIRTWQTEFPQGQIFSTGGDGAWLAQQLPILHYDPGLIFHGFAALRRNR
ncbi:pantothenate kinase [Picosynechococcus sp. PCC 11901]|uniref:pantothenate kinase n=1 Tax=Picosynechococcus sp. PCC 11901 TaxID=2579791 RepID=UPI0010FC255F|nr:pantothenate kinase [Picosynechococcus sp. PCC 11901]QCS50765.1 pantothenate kinase [Picosynechococcus sp. PCC 11901]